MRRIDFLEKGRLEHWNPGTFGVYVHVPFCLRRCRYCAFVSSVFKNVPSDDYADAVIAEFSSRSDAYRGRHLDTLYFGGGTPTALTDRALGRIVDHIAQDCGMPSEITLEANPEHIAPDRAAAWKDIGFTRISLGTQSFDAGMLAFLGRKHTPGQAAASVRCLQTAGFDEISLDLIYGGRPDPDMTADDLVRLWKSDLAAVRAFCPAHVSCYELTLEPHTPLRTMQDRGIDVKNDGGSIADMMLMIPDELGMARYEISNYERGGFLSSHNISCWAGLPYLGLGPGAHSLDLSGGRFARRANDGSVREYLAAHAAAAGKPFIPAAAFTETLSAQMHLAERLICAARTRFYWSPDDIAASIGADIAPYRHGIDKAVRAGWLECRGGLCRTTERGILLNNRLDEVLFEGAPEE